MSAIVKFFKVRASLLNQALHGPELIPDHPHCVQETYGKPVSVKKQLAGRPGPSHCTC